MADPWQWWPAARIAGVSGASVEAVRAHWPLIAGSLERRNLYERDICRGVIGTVAIETASTFRPLHEYGTPADWAGYSGGPGYAGRGYVQLTHDYNYRAAGIALGVDLLTDPDRALDPQIAADVLAWYWATKTIPSKDGMRRWTLAQLCRERDWVWVRRAVQGGEAGLDRLRQIVSDLGDESVAQLRVTEDDVRLRERPDTSSPILYQARAGELVEPVTDHAWRHVRVGGRTGWMAAEYLSSDPLVAPAETNGSGQILAFDPNTPAELQRQDWTCSIRSTMWMLKSLGIDVTPEQAQDAMSPRYVTSDIGLLDASGAGIVEVLRERWGLTAVNYSPVSFERVAQLAGRQPVMMGGRAWYHWVGVRGYDAARNVLVLANPARGPKYGQPEISVADWDRLGWWSAVTIPLA